jgi:hypothetical protein
MSNFSDKILSFNPKFYYRLGESAGTSAVDEVAGVNALYSSSPLLGQTSLIPSDALNTSVTLNSTQYIFLDNNAIGTVGDLSISVVVKLGAYSVSDAVLIAYGENSEFEAQNTLYLLSISPTGILKYQHESGAGVDTVITSTTTLQLNTTYIISLTRNTISKEILLYVDGLAVHTETYTNNPTGGLNSNNDVVIGVDLDRGAGGNLVGSMQDVAVFESKLTALEVSQIYEVYLAGIQSNDLFIDYKLDETVGTVVEDALGIYDGSYQGVFALADPRLSTSSSDSAGTSVAFNLGYISVPTTYKVRNASEISISLTLAFSGTTDLFVFDNKDTASPFQGLRCLANDSVAGDIKFSQVTADTVSSTSTDLNDGVNRRYTFVRTATRLQIWINGLLDAETIITVYRNSVAANFNFMSSANNSIKGVGKLDNIKVHDKALSANDVLLDFYANFETSDYIKLALSYTPLHYWQLGEAVNTKVTEFFGVKDGLEHGTVTLNSTGLSELEPTRSSFRTTNANAGITFEDTPIFSLAPFSISLLFKPEVLNSNSDIISKRKDNFNYEYGIRFASTNKLAFSVSGSGGTKLQITSSYPLVIGEKYHLVATYDGGTSLSGLKFYINAVNNNVTSVAGTFVSIVDELANLRVGSQSAGSSNGIQAEYQDFTLYDTELTPSQTLELYKKFKLTTNYSEAVIKLQPSAYYRMGESVGTVVESELGSNIGTYISNPVLAQTGLILGDSNTSVKFDGATNYMEVSTPFDVIGTSRTYVFSFKTTVNTQTGLVSHYNDTTGKNFIANVDASGFLEISFADASSVLSTVTSISTVDDGIVYHVIAIYDGSKTLLYINGVFEIENAVTIVLNQNSGTFEVGGRQVDTFTDFVDATISEVSIFNYGFNIAQVNDLYSASTTPQPNTNDDGYSTAVKALNPLRYFRFKETTGSIMFDESVNQAHGTHFNSPIITGGTMLDLGSSLGGSVEYNGVDQYSHATGLGTLGSFSMVFIALRTTSPTRTNVLLVDSTETALSTPDSWSFVNTSSINFARDGSTKLSEVFTLTDTPAHIVMTYDTILNLTTMHINGVLSDTSLTANIGNFVYDNIDLYLGTDFKSNSLTESDVKLAEVAIFDFALSDSQAKGLFNASLSDSLKALHKIPSNAFYRLFESGNTVRTSVPGINPATNYRSISATSATVAPPLLTDIRDNKSRVSELGNLSLNSLTTAANSYLNTSVFNIFKSTDFTGIQTIFDLRATSNDTNVAFNLQIETDGSLTYFDSDSTNTINNSLSFTTKVNINEVTAVILTKNTTVNTVSISVNGSAYETLPRVSTVNTGAPAYYFHRNRNNSNIRRMVGFTDVFGVYIGVYSEAEAIEFTSAFATQVASPTIPIIISEERNIDNWKVVVTRLGETSTILELNDQPKGSQDLEFPLSLAGEAMSVTVTPDVKLIWKPGTTFTLDDIIVATNASTHPYYFKCLVTGVTGSSEPNWGSSLNEIINEGTTSWVILENLLQPISQAPLYPSI